MGGEERGGEQGEGEAGLRGEGSRGIDVGTGWDCIALCGCKSMTTKKETASDQPAYPTLSS